MQYISHYASPLGPILLAADENGLTGLWFEGQKFCPEFSEPVVCEGPVLAEAKRWLDLYFSGQQPDFCPPLHPLGTPFQEEVWQILRPIPYGRTVTYGQIALQIASRRSLPRFSAQAVGNAVGRNPISILIPCHRVVGAGGQLTGYAGGLWRKAALLALEIPHNTLETR